MDETTDKYFEDFARLFHTAIAEGTNFHCNVIDRDYRIVWHNRVPGESRNTGQFCYAFYQKRDTPCMRCPVAVVFDSGKECILERKRYERLPNGRSRWGEIRAYPVSSCGGSIDYCITIGFDITEKRLEREKQQKHIENLERKLKTLAEISSGKMAAGHEGIHIRLTKRQSEVLKLMGQGLSNAEISKILSLSPHTIKSHVMNLFNKLGVNDRTEASALAVRLRLI
ncbi:MAG: LuxR C-terminal-related transcriptional regulator [Syntrophobacteraceae bacterium]